MPHNIHKQRLYKVTWREPESDGSAYWRTRRATVACYSVQEAITVIEDFAHMDAMISSVNDHGEIDYHAQVRTEE